VIAPIRPWNAHARGRFQQREQSIVHTPVDTVARRSIPAIRLDTVFNTVSAQFVRYVVSAGSAPGLTIVRVDKLTKLKRAPLLGVLCAGVVAVGCGSDTIDDAELEEEIKQDLAADVGVTPKVIDCPADIESRAGKTFECIGTAPSDDERFRISVKLTNDDGGFSAVVPPEQFEHAPS
jgi:hypothetical protein